MNETSQSWRLSGSLSDDAPGLYHDLRRSFNARALQFLARCYHESAAWGGVREFPVAREPGVAFAPRPARILRILLKESAPIAVREAGGALLCTVPLSYLRFARNELTAAVEIATEVNARNPATAVAQMILLARTLDEARHLHMTTLTRSEQAARYKLLASSIESGQRDYAGQSQCARLLELLQHWLQHSASKYAGQPGA